MDVRSSLWESGRDEEVQVNQRALIDKVLARYSGEHTVLRELLQNADDAGAKHVEIHFNTKNFVDNKDKPGQSAGINGGKLPDLTKELLFQWEFKNDGIPFREDDWNRLKKIAEGNPDEQKIGAFGVGFYSLFSVTDEPFVTSGGQWMGFYWKDNKDQLFARRGSLPPSPPPDPSDKKWTSFVMPLREASTFPARPVDIARFLATSLTFMSNLKGVSMFFNEHRLAHLTKGSGHTKAVPVPDNLDPTSKPMGIMQVKGINSIDLHIRAQVLRWTYHTGTEKPRVLPRIPDNKPTTTLGGPGGFFASLFSSMAGTRTVPEAPAAAPPPPLEAEPDLLEIVESSVGMTVYAAKIDIKLDKKFLVELERATKKQPPSTTVFSLIYTGKDEYDASKDEDERNFKTTGGVFHGLRADLDRAGASKIFIGHATSQSTGIGGHVSARFIPTVERESIDFQDRNVSKWNKELLYVGGFLARAVYEYQLSSIRTLWDEASRSSAPGDPIDESLRLWLEGKCLHALKFFTFYNTTPSAVVGTDMETAFFSCGKAKLQGEFPILSTAGVKPGTQVRTWQPEMRSFLKNVPMLPESIAGGAPAMVTFLREWGMISPVNFQDVITELSERALTEAEMLECLKWRMSSPNQPELAKAHQQFVQAAVVSIPSTDGGEDRVIPLASIKTFLSPGNVIPPTCPLPDHTLPFSLGKHFKPDELRQFFGWTDLNVVQWLEHLVSPEALKTLPTENNIGTSAPFAERVLSILAKAWGSLPKGQIERTVNLLQDVTVIPTKMGMKKPQEAYFANANVFPDLPTVLLTSAQVKGTMEKLLVALGVMKHVELQLVFDRMINTGDWGVQELLKYLVAVRTTLTDLEITKLKQTPAFPMETPKKGDKTAQIERRKPNELYEPTDALRELGLPVLDWGTQHKWRPGSEEAKFMRELGLQSYPSLATVISLAAGPDLDLRRKALSYLLENFSARYKESYRPRDFSHIAFIPSLRPDGTAFLGRHSDVFLNPECSVLGFSLVEPSLRNDAQTKLQVEKDPATSLIMPLLAQHPPRAHDTARQWFEYLASRVADFSADQLSQLKALPFIPVRPTVASTTSKSPIAMYKPANCFFPSERAATTVHSNLFTFVDFGSKANLFLRACGVKNEPSVPEIAAILLQNPKRFLELSDGPKGYLDELRQIAAYPNFQGTLVAQMRRTAFLLGSRRTPKPVASNSPRLAEDEDGEDEDYDVTYDLLRPDQVVVVDDTNTYSLFSDALYGAPQEDLLEAFYLSIGSPRLSSLTTEDYRPVQVESSASRMANDTRNLILQRFPLFLHERNAPARFRSDWLAGEGNFNVRGCGKLTLVRTLNFGGKRVTKMQEASAAAKLTTSFGSTGPLTLFISGHDKLDMYEVAHSICKVMLKNPKVNDSLLFMTILSTDLRALRRRGYNVDRIIHQQKAEQKLLAAQRAAEAEAPMPPGADPFQSVSPPVVPVPRQEKPIPAATNPRPTLEKVPQDTDGQRKDPPPPNSSIRSPSPDAQTLAPSRSRSTAVNTLSSLKDRWSRRIGAPSGLASTSNGAPVPSGSQGGEEARVTPTKDIERNIRTAIAACREEKSSVLANRQQMSQVKETIGDGYCDISGTDQNFNFMSTVEGYRFYIAKDVVDPREVTAAKLPVLARFASAVIKPLAQVYKLPSTSIHVFWDQHGGLIAFNRNGSLFLNLRYYENWHDAEVQQGQVHKALISWYHSLAHEIAHNLVHPHNSEHEFYFSAICENHLMGLVGLLTQTRVTSAA